MRLLFTSNKKKKHGHRLDHLNSRPGCHVIFNFPAAGDRKTELKIIGVFGCYVNAAKSTNMSLSLN